MKSKAFTLMEILIALGIVAIVSAILVTNVSKNRPDKYKTQVLKYYSTLAKVTDDLLAADGIYNICTKNNLLQPPSLTCTIQPTVSPYSTTTYKGNNKYKNLVVDMLGIDSDGNYTDNSNWTVTQITTSLGGYTVLIDINGTGTDNTPNCVYDKNNETCTEPDRYRFWVQDTGEVLPDDAMTAAYINNPKGNHSELLEYATSHIKEFPPSRGSVIGGGDTPADD